MDKINTKETNWNFKLLYAIGIYLIVAGHVFGGGFSIFYEFIPSYAYHVALFIFASGYFYKHEYVQNVTAFISKKIKRLIVPLYLWNFFYAALILFFLSKFNLDFNSVISFDTLFIKPINNGHQFMYNSAGWFIAPLFFVHVYNICLRKLLNGIKFKYKELFYTILAFAIGIIGVIISEEGFNANHLFLTRLMYFIPFYQLGILYKKYEKYDTVNNLLYFGIIIAAELYIIFTHNGTLSYEQAWSKYSNGCIWPLLVAILGIAFWVRICKILSPLMRQSKTINTIAENTYAIMINQYISFMLVKTVFAILHKYTNLCSGFNMLEYKNNFWYYYCPHNLSQFLILYVIAGIVIPIIMQKTINRVYDKFKHFRIADIRKFNFFCK